MKDIIALAIGVFVLPLIVGYVWDLGRERRMRSLRERTKP